MTKADGVGGSFSAGSRGASFGGDNNSHKDSTSTESMAATPTIAESLSGVGSHDGAQERARQGFQYTASKQTSIESIASAPSTTDAIAAQPTTTDSLSTVGSLDAAHRSAQRNQSLNTGTPESRTSEASIAGSIVQGALNTYSSRVDANGRLAAHDVLSNGNAGNFTAPNGVKQSSVAADFLRTNNTAAQALDATPYSSAARSTQHLTDAANTVGRINRIAGPIGTYAGPVIGAVEAAYESAPDASIGDRVANIIGGGLKEADDVAVSAVAFTGVTATQVALSPFAGPAAPAVAITAPASGAVAAIGASEYYDGKGLDNAFDSAVDNYVEPAIAATVDGVMYAARATSDAVTSVYRSIKAWFQE